MDRIRLHQFSERLELGGYAARTRQDYIATVERFMRYLDEQEHVRGMVEVREAHVRAYEAWLQAGQSGRKLSPRGLNSRLYAVKTFFRLMYQEGLVGADLGKDIALRRVRKNPPRYVPNQQQVRELLEVCEPCNPLAVRDRAILELLYATGIRNQELRQLTLEDWDETAATLFVRGKGGKDRIVPVGGWVGPYLREYRDVVRPRLAGRDTPADLLFLSKSGRMLARYNLGKMIQKYAERAGVAHVTAHLLRHACATHLLENGADIRYVQELLGHADLSSTQIYTKVDVSLLKKAHNRYHPRQRGDDESGS